MSDYPLGQTLDFKFSTRAFATGIPTTLAGTPVIQIYEDNSVTQITAGITLTVDFDSVTGLHNIRVVATSGNGFGANQSYACVLSAGTVGGVSVVGEVVAQFSIERSSAFARLGAPAGASISADIAGVPTVAELNARTLVSASYFDPATDGVLFAASAQTSMVDDVWDRVLTGATHNITNSAGRRVREIPAGVIVDEGTAQAGAAGTITLRSGASATDNIYSGDRVTITDGTGAGEHGIIVSYVGATRIATMARNWVVNPDNTSEYQVMPADVDVSTWFNVPVSAIETSVDHRIEMDGNSTRLATLAGGIIEGATTGTPSTTSTNTDLTGFLNSELSDRVIVFTGGTANGQAADILTYTATNGVITFVVALTTAPAASDPFKII